MASAIYGPTLCPICLLMSTGTKVKEGKIVSCAECRRLKLKCDRNFPCYSCRKRGLTALCPNVALPTRIRKSPAESARSTNTIPDMALRIRELEDALQALHGTHSDSPHPLLPDRGKTTIHMPLSKYISSDTARPVSPGKEDPDELDGLDESLGTLAIDPESGKSSFFGQSAGMESLYHADLREAFDSPEFQPGWSTGPFDPLRDTLLDPLYPQASSDMIFRYLEGHLPDPQHAWKLCDLYYRNAAWLYTPIPRDRFKAEILIPVYSTAIPSLASVAHFEVSILFMVFAIGSLLDISDSCPSDSGKQNFSSPTGSIDGLESDLYHQLARAALTAGSSAIEDPTLSGVRVIFLMAYYHMLLNRKQTPQNVWSLTSIAVGVAISIGLHRDSSGWNLDPSIVEQRRNLFWELYVFVSFQATLSFGRPPQIASQFVDCEVGPDTEKITTADGTAIHGYYHRLRMIASTVLSEIRDLILSTKQRYSDVVAMDRKLRDCAVELFGAPVGCRKVGPEVLKGPNTVVSMQNFYLLAMKEILVLYLHRKYLVRALSSRSEELPASRYYPSLLAAFRSAQVVILIVDGLLTIEPVLPCRFWFFWNHVLASAIIVGSLPIRHPRSVLAPEGMSSLEDVVEQLHRCESQVDKYDRVTGTLKLVIKLRDKARWAMYQPESSAARPEQHDELSILAGHTRVVSTRPPSSPTQPPASLTSTLPVVNLHASLVEDPTLVVGRDQGVLRGDGTLPPTDVDLLSDNYAPQQYVYPDTLSVSGVGGMGDSGAMMQAHQNYFQSNGGDGLPGVTMMDDTGHVYAVASQAVQDWTTMQEGYNDISWQGFAAQLGVSGGE